MNTILNDDERPKLPDVDLRDVGQSIGDIRDFLKGYATQHARDTEAAVLAKLREQEPVAWHAEDHLDDRSATTYSKEAAQRWQGKGWPVTPLYAAPLPTVVQVPTLHRIQQHLANQHHYSKVEFCHKLAELLAAAPEAPAQPSVPAPWREAVKVAREALKTCERFSVSEWEVVDMTPKIVRAALAQLDSLEGGE